MKHILLFGLLGVTCFCTTAQTIPVVGKNNLLEIATWNAEWLGDAGAGPTNEPLQAININNVIKTTDMDLWGLQEISSSTAWNNLLANNPLYDGAISTWSQTQKTALLFKKSKFKLIYQKNILALYEQEFASGRLPLEVSLQYKADSLSNPDTMYFFVLHMKANTGNSSEKTLAFNRRKSAADQLRLYINADPKFKFATILGDWNDDVDFSILTPNPSPFKQFLNDTTNFFFATEYLSLNGKSSTTSYNNVIDHICLTKSMKNGTTNTNINVLNLTNSISNYSNSTSDHYPVYIITDPTKWKRNTSSTKLSRISNSNTIFWNGKQLVYPNHCKEPIIYSITGKIINIEKLQSNQIYFYQTQSNSNLFTGKFIVN